jgi:NAD(P)-dependent dehydrogenase (short-subunit alcohol dehydrogenase family)
MKWTKEDWNDKEQYNGLQRYRTSKLCNVMFLHALARRLQGTQVVALGVSPGFIPITGLSRNERYERQGTVRARIWKKQIGG